MQKNALQIAAVVAAVAILAAPHLEQIKQVIKSLISAAKDHGGTISRFAAAGLILAAAAGSLPMPPIPAVPSVLVEIDDPPARLKELVAPVTEAMKDMSRADKQLWAIIWLKSAEVVEMENATAEQVLKDTSDLRTFTTITLEIAWRRIGDRAPGSAAGLREAVERVLSSEIGMNVVPLDRAVQSSYVAAARAIGWAAIGG